MGNRTAFQPRQWQTVNDASLKKIKGGFDVGKGLSVSFGILRTVTIDGGPVYQNSVIIPNLAQMTPDQAKALSEMVVIQNGSRNYANPSFKSSMGGLLIQNSNSNTQIQAQTQLDIGVKNLGIFRAINLQNVLRDAQLGSILGAR